MSKQEENLAWLPAPRDYQVALRGSTIVCQNSKGRILATIPKWLKEEEVTDRLEGLRQWLDGHREECRLTIERWMLRSLVIPSRIASEIWPDASWREMLRNLVVAPATKKGKVDFDRAGILRDVLPSKGLGVVDMDGETQWLKAPAFVVPHPILIQELSELRELASDLSIEQNIEQLYRPVHQPTKQQMHGKSIRDFENGVFEQLSFAMGYCRRLGYAVRGGYATCRIWEGATSLEARYYIGEGDPEYQAWTGDLIFVDQEMSPWKIGDVGPVTFSEGVRMAAAIYAKRKVDTDEGDRA